MQCLKCGFTNPDQARFCAGCGLKFSTIDCHHCHVENSPGSHFCNACGQPLTNKPSPKAIRSAHSERRILTVLFCDLVDSTKLVDKLDPELSRAIIRDFQRICAEIIDKHGGQVSTYLGDGIVALFSRHESNAERAINTALHINREIEQTEDSFSQSGQKIEVRSGIATGLAVVGDNMPGDSNTRQETAIGLPLNLAARIQSLAEPGGVAIGSTTHQMTSELFEFEDIGHHLLKGIRSSQQVWRVIAEKSISARFVAHAARMTPMVDRTGILEKLKICWDKSTHEKGEVVVFTGEPGVGKSRIAQQLTDTISAESQYYDLEYQCSPNHTNTALYPVINRLKTAAGFEHGESSAVQIDKLQMLIRESSDNFEQDMPAFVELLSLPAGEKWQCPNLDPDEKKEWIFNTLIRNIFSLSKVNPLLITFEDLHWVDPTTLELLTRIVNTLEGHAILFVMTSRPGFTAAFLKLPYVTELEVESLPHEYAQQLVYQVKGDTNISTEMLEDIIQRTEGNPLFIEEFSKSLLESISIEGLVGQPNAHEKLLLPATVQESLLARLDHLPKASRDIAHLAAVIGRDFSYDLLESVAEYQNKNLYHDLTPLLNAQLVLQRKPPPNAEFSFKHALVRDVAYETLLRSDLIAIHKRIAEIIENKHPDILSHTPELVAQHFTQGRDYEKAIEYWLKAGKKASQSSANVEARNHLEKGLSLLKKINNKKFSNQIELEILLTLGPIFMSIYGTGAKQTHKVYLRAFEISDDQLDAGLRFIALWNRWRISVDDGFRKVAKWADKLLVLAEKTKNIDQLLQAHHCQWGTLYNLGHQTSCCEHIEAGIRLYDENMHRHHASTYGGHDPKVCGYSQSALSLWLMGDYIKAGSRLEKGQIWADHLDHLGTHLHQIDISLMYFRFCNDPSNVLDQVEKLGELIKLTDYQDYSSKAKIYSGWARGMLGEPLSALRLLEEGIKEHAATGTWEDKPVFLEMSAQIKRKLEDYDGALQDISQALKSAELSGVEYWDAELHRRKAQLLLEKNDQISVELAKASYHTAIDIALKQQTNTLALRAATGLAAFYIKQGEPEKVLLTVEPILKKFDPRQSTDDILKAISLVQSVLKNR